MRHSLAIVAALVLVLPATAARAAEAPDLVPFVLPWDDASPGPTDLSSWNHTPAGKFGPVRAGPDGHLYAGNERIRFFGTNLCFGACFPEKEDAPKIAARMAKFGINVVRFHHMDNRQFPDGLWTRDEAGRPVLSSESLDRLDCLTAALIEHGIYVNLNLLVSRRFTPADGLPASVNEVKGKANHLLGYFHEPSFELHRAFARDLLGHRNAYTGRTYAAEPGVAFIEIMNENGILNYWFDTKREPHLEDLPSPFREALEQRWHAYLEAKGAAPAPLVPREGFEKLPVKRQHDWISFLWNLERDYYAAMTRVIKQEMGSRALVMGSTTASSTPNIMAETTDVLDNHVYWENPRWRGRTWDYNGLDWSISNTSHFDGDSPGGRLRWVAGYRVAGKPFSVTEFNHSAPNVWAGEAPIFLATFGAIQDWDALYLFTYEHGRDWDRRFAIGLNISQHPTKMANLPVAAAVFRRMDVRPAREAVRASLTPQDEVRVIAEDGRPWQMANAFDVGLDGDDTIRHRMEIVTAPGVAAPAAAADDAPRPTRFASDTGEVVWDASGPGTAFTIDTPRTKLLAGPFGRRAVVLGPVTFDPGASSLGGGTISLVLTEGESFERPRRALLVATARIENTGMKWKQVPDPKDPDAPPRWELESWGEAPTIIEPMPASVTVPAAGRTVRAWALDERGQRGEPVKVKEADGRATLHIGPPHATLWYEVEWGRR